MIRTGTAYFSSIGSAERYYHDYGYDAHDVQAKIEAGEIHIGKPDLKPRQRLVLDRSEGRYFIEED